MTSSSTRRSGQPSRSRPRRPAGAEQPPVRFAGLVRGGATFMALVVGAAAVAALVGTAGTADPAVVGLAAPGPLVEFGIPVMRTLLDVAAVATAGLGLLSRFIGFDDPDRAEPVLRRVRRVAVWTAAAWAAAALTSIVLLTAELQPGSVPSPADVWRYIGNIPAGKGLLLSAACALASVWLARLAVRHGERVPAELRTGLALFGLLPLPLTGHASNWQYHDLSMVLMELHVVTASAWAGGLGAVIVFLVRRPDLLAVALPRFSRLATWCVVAVGVTGLFTGILELALSPLTELPSSLWTTRYGVLILAKTLCMVVVAVIAVVVRTRFLPHIANRQRTAVALWCGWELIVLAVAFGVAVVLTRSSVTLY
ncbi:copper resistance D family protein [Nakamurella leprariae]|uniref:CopD family protein n=1 Tax=Nakamurella leprariae TaxID=2803911 RepID=A0A938YE80_9ACTN|nr:CopD family protein [Nakamurella leprariae]MBM9467953.1 CopD family protein [Nakamurella leprariae]